MFGRHAFALLLVLATGALPGYGQQFTPPSSVFSIDGNVRENTDQRGVENVRVDLKQPDGIPVGHTFTQDNGAFEFSGVPNGKYILEVNAQNFQPLQQAVEIRNAGRQSVSLLLTRSAHRANMNFSGAVISAHQLGAPRKAQEEYAKGMDLLYDKSDYRGAIGQLQRAIKDFPTYYEAYALVGTAYQNLGEMAAAEEALRKSVELSSGRYSEALSLLSALLSNAKRYEEAVTFARKSVQVDVNSWQGAFELARALSGLKQFEEAEKIAVLARDKNPDNPTVYVMLANIHIGRHDYPSLATDLDTYLKISPNGSDANWVRKTQEQMQENMKRQAENSPRGNAQNPDGAIEPAPETDSSGLPPLGPPTPSDP
jgi:tetratricopeptide (TPR) repeat protein